MTLHGTFHTWSQAASAPRVTVFMLPHSTFSRIYVCITLFIAMRKTAIQATNKWCNTIYPSQKCAPFRGSTRDRQAEEFDQHTMIEGYQEKARRCGAW